VQQDLNRFRGTEALGQSEPSAPSAAKTRKQRLGEALRANLRRRKVNTNPGASQDSKKPEDQPRDESSRQESDL
jgi:hypothetical protein